VTTKALKIIFLSVLAFILGVGRQPHALAEANAAEVQAVSADEERAPEYPGARQQTVDERARETETTFLPTGDLFTTLLADPKEPRFYLSYRVFKFRTDQIHAAVGGYGEIFGLYRHRDTGGGYDWQANFGGGIHSQFDLQARSLDLVNTDYLIGFPFSFRKGAESYRFTLYHQSSHLGDEFLLHNNIERIELSFEALDLLRSYEWKTWRIYYGGAYLIHKEPADMKPALLHGGVEYYAVERLVGRSRLVAGWDLKSDEEHDWSLNSSLKFGLQTDSSAANGRYIRVLVEGYKGFTPYGQFFRERISYAGIGVYLGFE
jgi:uncharacterized protein DUF1207